MKFLKGWGLQEKTFAFTSDELKFIIDVLEYVKLNTDGNITILEKIIDGFKKGE